MSSVGVTNLEYFYETIPGVSNRVAEYARDGLKYLLVNRALLCSAGRFLARSCLGIGKLHAESR